VKEGLVRITKDSDLYLICSVFLKEGKPVWDIRKMLLDAGGASTNNYLTFYRWTKPTSSLPDEMKDLWKKEVLEHGHPYSGTVYAENGRMNVGTIHPDFVIDGKVTIQKDFAYTFFASKEGTVAEEDMKNYLQDFVKETRIKE
jgi:hypothetical protein